MPTMLSGLRYALVAGALVALTRDVTHDAVMWRGYLAFRLPFKVTVAVGREWRG